MASGVGGLEFRRDRIAQDQAAFSVPLGSPDGRGRCNPHDTPSALPDSTGRPVLSHIPRFIPELTVTWEVTPSIHGGTGSIAFIKGISGESFRTSHLAGSGPLAKDNRLPAGQTIMASPFSNYPPLAPLRRGLIANRWSGERRKSGDAVRNPWVVSSPPLSGRSSTGADQAMVSTFSTIRRGFGSCSFSMCFE